MLDKKKMKTKLDSEEKQMLTITQDMCKVLYRLYNLGYEKEAEAITAVFNIARASVEDRHFMSAEEYLNDYLSYIINTQAYLKEVASNLPQPKTNQL